jgi:hypothetical protein
MKGYRKLRIFVFDFLFFSPSGVTGAAQSHRQGLKNMAMEDRFYSSSSF